MPELAMKTFTPGLHLRSPARRPLALAAEQYVVPAHIDRRSELLPASNQGGTSQCVAYGLAGWLEYYRWKNEGDARQVDPQPIYNRAKEIDGLGNVEGTTLEAGLQAAQHLGLITPVDNDRVRTITTPAQVRQALHRHGVVLGAFNVRAGWLRASAGGWIQPGGEPMGGHCALLCGYSLIETPPWFAIQNSWGEGQGWRGFNRLSVELFAEQFDYGLVWESK